jgi:hypothetical protein
VTITNQDTGIVSLTQSSAFDEYRSDNLQPGTYMVKIEALGFRDTISVGNVVTVDNNNRVDSQHAGRQPSTRRRASRAPIE